MLLRREIEKLVLYVGRAGRVDEEAVLACGVEGAGIELDEALMAATTGEVALADRALEATFAEGTNPVQVVRAALRHMQRLHEAALLGADGASLRPPVFFRHRGAFDRATRLWPVNALEAAARHLLETERRLKTTAFRDGDVTLARAAVAMLARQAAAYVKR
jgi:DNA polymerase-3 subunit delta